MPRRRLLVLAQLLALAGATSLLAASPVHTRATPPCSPAVPRAAATPAVVRGARRLGSPRLSELPSDSETPAAATSPDADGPSPAPAPGPDAADDDGGLAFVVSVFLIPAIVVLGYAAGFALLALLSFILRKGAALLASSVADLYAAARAAREKAIRVRPLGQDGVEAAGT